MASLFSIGCILLGALVFILVILYLYKRQNAITEKERYARLNKINTVLIGLRNGQSHDEFVTTVVEFIEHFLKYSSSITVDDETDFTTFVEHLPLLDVVKLVRALLKEPKVATDDVLDSAHNFIGEFVKYPPLLDSYMESKKLSASLRTLIKILFRELKRRSIEELNAEEKEIIDYLQGYSKRMEEMEQNYREVNGLARRHEPEV